MKKRLLSVLIISILLLMCACGDENMQAEGIAEEATEIVESTKTNDNVIEEETETQAEEKWDRIPMVMVDGQIYYATGKESTIEARCGMMDGEITSSVEGSEVPTENNQSNFGAGYGYQYGVEGTIEVQMEDGNWYVYETGSGEGKIRFGNSNKWYDKGYLSDDTLKWMHWYNSLSEEEQLAVSSIPKELLDGWEKVEVEEASASIRIDNPSWDYYQAENIQSGTKPYTLQLIEESANEIIDTEEWFIENELSYISTDMDETYHCVIENNGTLINIFEGDTCIAGLDFTDYMYSPDYVEADKDYIDETVHDAKIKDGILYVSIFHYTYAASAPSNAYITAIGLDNYEVLWKSQPLVCNSLNFEIVDDIIFCGYGFTAEDDYLYQIDRITGCVLEKYKLMSKPDYIVYKDDKLYVRTYNTNYVMEVVK